MADTEKKPEKPHPKIYLVYVGPCETADGKLGAKFIKLTDAQFKQKRLPEVTPDERVYSGTVPKGVGRPGTIYQFEVKDDDENTIYGTTRSFAGFLENDPRVMDWQAICDTFHHAKMLVAQKKKGKNKNLVQERLAPLKVLYSQMVGRNRVVLLAQIIGYVTGRVTNEDMKLAARAAGDTDFEEEGEDGL